MKDTFRVETLFRTAWGRYRKHIGSIVLAFLIGTGMILSTFFGLGLVGVVLVALLSLVKLWFLYIIFAPIFIGLFLAAWYMLTWVSLARIRILTDHYQEKKVWDNFKAVVPLTPHYMIVGLVTGLFMMGLWYTFIFLVPLVVWLVWSSFLVFVYLDEKRGGLYPLWKSRELVRGKFMPVFGRLAILWVLAFVIGSVFRGLHVFAPLSLLISFLVLQPFILAYTYEMYLQVKEKKKQGNKEVQSAVWLGVSVIGWVLIVVALLFGSVYVFQNMRF